MNYIKPMIYTIDAMKVLESMGVVSCGSFSSNNGVELIGRDIGKGDFSR
jgi:hypothetical protein